jgi:hypothetical protein
LTPKIVAWLRAGSLASVSASRMSPASSKTTAVASFARSFEELLEALQVKAAAVRHP